MNKNLQKMSQLADDAYGMAVMLKEYCEKRRTNEEVGVMYPLIKHLFRDIDSLNLMFINRED